MGKAGGALGKLTMPLRQGIAGIGAAATIQGSIFQQGLSGLLGKAGGVVSGIANSGAGKAVGGAYSAAGPVCWGVSTAPIAGGLGSLLSGALPIVGVISGIIAVVSILTDKFGGLDKIIQRVFGDTDWKSLRYSRTRCWDCSRTAVWQRRCNRCRRASPICSARTRAQPLEALPPSCNR